jgi:lipopolysaccharide/colanic/teichoic acid biosynthesis glycosyltransferase
MSRCPDNQRFRIVGALGRLSHQGPRIGPSPALPSGWSSNRLGAHAKAIIGRVVATCGVVVLMPMLLTVMVKSIKDRVDCDIRYVDNWSIISDIPINLRTIVELVRGRNAY